MSSRTERFQRKPQEPQERKKEEEVTPEPEEVLRFSPEEEAVRFLIATITTHRLKLYT
jgi:hypothetical protein